MLIARAKHIWKPCNFDRIWGRVCDRICGSVWCYAQLLCLLFAGSLYAPAAGALGTSAGVNIENSATVNFSIAGTAQTPVQSNTTQTRVDELIDVVVVNNNGGTVAVGTPQNGALLEFSVTNNGNGEEVFRVIADADIAEGGFNPVLNQLYLETNGVPGLQIGSDTAYLPGSADPTLTEDETLIVYVEANIPLGLAQNELGEIQLRAVSTTIFAQAGTDDPAAPAWPAPGTQYAGLGDGGGDLVVGVSHDNSSGPANLLVVNAGQFQVSAAVVSLVKSVLSISDPFGGSTLVPGSVITYQLQLSVSGTGTADNVLASDVLPTELDYVTNTLQINGVAEDDDFSPAGTDASGFDTATRTVLAASPSLVGGAAPTLITFAAVVR